MMFALWLDDIINSAKPGDFYPVELELNSNNFVGFGGIVLGWGR